MSLTLQLLLLLISCVARATAKTSDPSANLDVRQLISLKCLKMHWVPNVLAHLLLKFLDLLREVLQMPIGLRERDP